MQFHKSREMFPADKNKEKRAFCGIKKKAKKKELKTLELKSMFKSVA